MQYTHALLLLALMGWLTSGGTSILAQEMAPPSRTPASEETTLDPGVPPTPRFLQVEVDIGAGGLGPLPLHYDPARVGLHRPQMPVAVLPPPPSPPPAP